MWVLTSSEPEAPPEVDAAAAKTLVDQLLDKLVRGVVNGVPGIPSIEERKTKLLDEHGGDIDAALSSVSMETCWKERAASFAVACVPVVGGAAVHMQTLWRRATVVALIASLLGHDLEDAATQSAVILCVVHCTAADGVDSLTAVGTTTIAAGASSVAASVVQSAFGKTFCALPVSVIWTSLSRIAASDENEAVLARARAYFDRRVHSTSTRNIAIWGAAFVACKLAPQITKLALGRAGDVLDAAQGGAESAAVWLDTALERAAPPLAAALPLAWRSSVAVALGGVAALLLLALALALARPLGRCVTKRALLPVGRVLLRWGSVQAGRVIAWHPSGCLVLVVLAMSATEALLAMKAAVAFAIALRTQSALQLLKGIYSLLAVASARGWGKKTTAKTSLKKKKKKKKGSDDTADDNRGGSGGGRGNGSAAASDRSSGAASGSDGANSGETRFSLKRLRWDVRLCLAVLSLMQLLQLLRAVMWSSDDADGGSNGSTAGEVGDGRNRSNAAHLAALAALASDASLSELARNVADIVAVLALSSLLDEVRSVETLVAMLGPENAVRTLETALVYGVAVIGQALADPAALLGWLDASTPSPAVCCVLLATARIAAVAGAMRGAMSQQLLQPLLDQYQPWEMSPGVAEAVCFLLLLSAAVNWEWMTRAAELNSRHRLFLLLPPSKHTETIVKITRLVETFDARSRQVGGVVGRVGSRIHSVISSAAWGAAHPIAAVQSWWRGGGDAGEREIAAQILLASGSSGETPRSPSRIVDDSAGFELIELDEEVRVNALHEWPELPPLLGEEEGDTSTRLAATRARVTAWWQHAKEWTGIGAGADELGGVEASRIEQIARAHLRVGIITHDEFDAILAADARFRVRGDDPAGGAPSDVVAGVMAAAAAGEGEEGGEDGVTAVGGVDEAVEDTAAFFVDGVAGAASEDARASFVISPRTTSRKTAPPPTALARWHARDQRAAVALLCSLQRHRCWDAAEGAVPVQDSAAAAAEEEEEEEDEEEEAEVERASATPTALSLCARSAMEWARGPRLLCEVPSLRPYLEMLSLGVPPGRVRLKMQYDGWNAEMQFELSKSSTEGGELPVTCAIAAAVDAYVIAAAADLAAEQVRAATARAAAEAKAAAAEAAAAAAGEADAAALDTDAAATWSQWAWSTIGY